MSFIQNAFAAHPLHSREDYMRTWMRLADELGMPDKRGACVCTGMCSFREAGSRDSVGVQQIWCPGNNADPCFKANPGEFPHDSMGNDGKSVGPFQQQTSGPPPDSQWGWGGLYGDPEGTRKRMDMYESSKLFMSSLKAKGYNASNANTANDSVQAVQGSGVPDAYAKWWNEANELYDKVIGLGGAGQAPATPAVPAPAQSNLTPGPFTGDPDWLADVLRAEGLNVVEMDGWKTRGNGDQGRLWGAVFHHTGNVNETPEGIAFHPTLDLAAHLLVRPDGTVYVCGIGRAWHAGVGSWEGIETDNANAVTIGVEVAILPVEGAPHRSGWPDVQYLATVKVMAAILRRLAEKSNHVISHKEWAQLGPLGWRQGKWDPGAIDMNIFRNDVQNQIDSKGTDEDMANVPQEQWDAFYQSYMVGGPSISIYATPGETVKYTPAQLMKNLDRNDHMRVVEDSALDDGDDDAITRIVTVAAGQGQFPQDTWAINHAEMFLEKLRTQNPTAWATWQANHPAHPSNK